MPRDRRPRAPVFDIAAELLEAEAPIGSREDIDTAVVLGSLDALQHEPTALDMA